MGVDAAEVSVKRDERRRRGGGGGGGGVGRGGAEAHRSTALKADDDCVDVVSVKLRHEVGAGALRVLQCIADAQVECGASPVMGTSTDLQKRDK
jgi:hypothetical protein